MQESDTRTVFAGVDGRAEGQLPDWYAEQPHSLLSYGVEDPAAGLHGDEAYRYVVDLPRREDFDDPVEWTVTESGHASFPRWEGPTEAAFERASWGFEGPLHGALEVLGGQVA